MPNLAVDTATCSSVPVTSTLDVTLSTVSPSKRQSIIATIFGVLMLIALVMTGAFLVASGRDFWVCAVVGCLLTVPFALSAWHGELGKKGGSPQTLADWLLFFVVGAGISAVFFAMDVAVENPGFGLIFTLGALSVTFIALPGAVRAWLIERLVAREQNRGGDV